MYWRWPQVGSPFLQPPPTPKFAFAGSCSPLAVVMMNPPPVMKSQGVGWAFVDCPMKMTASAPTARAQAGRVNLRMMFSSGRAAVRRIVRSAEDVVIGGDLLNAGFSGRNHDVRDARNHDVKPVDHGAAGRRLLLVDHEA